jgi:hypothetical protein
VRVRAEVRLRGRWAAVGELRVRGRAFVVRRAVAPGPLRARLRVLRTAGYPYEPSVSRAVPVRRAVD